MAAIFGQIECSFLQNTLGSYVWKAKQIILAPKIHFRGAGEAFFPDLGHFSEIEDFFGN